MFICKLYTKLVFLAGYAKYYQFFLREFPAQSLRTKEFHKVSIDAV